MSTASDTSAVRSAARAAPSPGGISVVGAGLLFFAVVNLAIAVMLALAPHAFFENVGPYGAQNDHYMRDLATFYAMLGSAGLIAFRRVAWRGPVLWCMALEYALHTLNHLVDIGAAHTHWLGPANFASLAIGTGTLVWLARESAQTQEAQR